MTCFDAKDFVQTEKVQDSVRSTGLSQHLRSMEVIIADLPSFLDLQVMNWRLESAPAGREVEPTKLCCILLLCLSCEYVFDEQSLISPAVPRKQEPVKKTLIRNSVQSVPYLPSFQAFHILCDEVGQ